MVPTIRHITHILIVILASLVTTLPERETRSVRNALPGNIATRNSFQNAKSAQKEKPLQITSPTRARRVMQGSTQTEQTIFNVLLVKRVVIKTNPGRRPALCVLWGNMCLYLKHKDVCFVIRVDILTPQERVAHNALAGSTDHLHNAKIVPPGIISRTEDSLSACFVLKVVSPILRKQLAWLALEENKR